MLNPLRLIRAQIALKRLTPPRHFRRRYNRRKGRHAGKFLWILKVKRERSMPAHRMPHNTQSLTSNRKLPLHKIKQLISNIALHVKMLRPWRLGRIDIKTSTLPEIIGLIISDIIPSRRCIRRNDDQPKLCRLFISPCFGRKIIMCACQAR